MGHRLTIKLCFSLITLGHVCPTSSAQSKIPGNYMVDKNSKDVFLNLNKDSTFSYSWKGHMWSDKSSGLYKTKGDTIYLKFRPLTGDTSYQDGKMFILPTEALSAINRPDTLFYRKAKLFRLENGQVVDRTKRGKATFIKSKGWRKWVRRKYYLFGPYISRKRRIHYLDKVD